MSWKILKPTLVVQTLTILWVLAAIDQPLPPVVLIGHYRCALQIIKTSKSVSGQHCRILIKDGSARLQDLGSLNGTFVNDERVHNNG